jgi:hypothetical protein
MGQIHASTSLTAATLGADGSSYHEFQDSSGKVISLVTPRLLTRFLCLFKQAPESHDPSADDVVGNNDDRASERDDCLAT